MTNVCPGCNRQLADHAKAHCLDKRTKPCGWVRCVCGVVLDRHGHHFASPPAST